MKGRPWLWGLLAVPFVCCAGLMVVGAFATKPPPSPIAPGVEPKGTCAFEVQLSGAKQAGGPVTVMLASGDEAGAYPATATRDGKLRLAGVPCGDEERDFQIAVMTADGRGGRLHATIGGNVPALHGKSGTLFRDVPIDLDEGLTFSGRVVDEQAAPLAGVKVSPVYVTYGRDGWAPPGVFAVTDADGRFRLQGVNEAKLTKDATRLGLYQQGRPWKEQPASPGEVPDIVLPRQ